MTSYGNGGMVTYKHTHTDTHKDTDTHTHSYTLHIQAFVVLNSTLSHEI